MIAAQAIRAGIDVLKPIAEHGRYDLAFDLGETVVRVQCNGHSERERSSTRTLPVIG